MEESKKNIPLYKKALLLEYLTIAWNIMEGIACVTLGLISGSVSLMAYGLESSVEVFASSVVVWELKSNSQNSHRIALKLIGAAYLVVSAYIFVDGSKSLLSGEHAAKSLPGIIFLIVTAIVMLTLGLMKKTAGNKLKSETVLADAKFTLIDAALSCTVLIGLIFNYLFGWWWMDQALALFLSGVAFKEGLKEIL